MKDGLTMKQERFCQEFSISGNASEAYRRAYDTSKMKDATLRAAASALLKETKIADRIRELTQATLEEYAVTRERIIKELADIGFAKIVDKPKMTDKIKAIAEMAKMIDAPAEQDRADIPSPMNMIME